MDSTCSHLAPNLATKNPGNRRSWELNFQNFPEEHLPGPQWLIQGGRGAGGLCSLPPLFGFFSSSFYKNKFTSKKLYVVLNEYEICLKMLEMAILETHIFKTFWGEYAPRLPRKLVPLALIVPPPPLKVLDPLEISHTQQFFNLGISGRAPSAPPIILPMTLSSHTIPWIPG